MKRDVESTVDLFSAVRVVLSKYIKNVQTFLHFLRLCPTGICD